MIIDIHKAGIFNRNRIISGVTLSNYDKFPGKGFSIFPGEILTGDEVDIHRQILAETLGRNLSQLIFQKQVHEDHIRIIDEHSGEEISDGMITNRAAIILNVTIADCCAVLIHDPVNDAIAALHSGWRGTARNIVARGISMLNEVYSSDPETLVVYLSACASGKRYEVGEEVAELFPDSIRPAANGKFLLDIRKEIKSQMIRAGVKNENIEISDKCTIEDRNYHSFRRDGKTSGRMSGFIGLIPA